MKVVTLVGLIACSVAAHAQDLNALVSTLSVTQATTTTAGKFRGCTMNFQASARDFAYRKGALVVADGSFSIDVIARGDSMVPMMMVKLGVLEVGKQKPEPPEFAFIQSGKGTTAGSVVNSGFSDTPGYQVYVVKMEEPSLNALLGMMDTGKFKVGYNRIKNGTDVIVDVDMEVLETKPSDKGWDKTRSLETRKGFSDCVLRVFDAVTKK